MNPIDIFIDFSLLVRGLVTLISKFVLERFFLHKRHFIRGILIGFVISVGVTIVAWLGHFRPFENTLTDFLQLITFKKAGDVALLFITEEEYKQGFNAASPLSRERLGRIVDVLVGLKARVIALDIDISDPTPDDHKLSEAICRASTAGIPVVVIGNHKAIDARVPSGDTSGIGLRPYSDENLKFTEDGFVLLDAMSPGSQWVNKLMYGGVIFRLDSDFVFRQAEALYMVKDADSRLHPAPSFPVAAAAAYKGMSQKGLQGALSGFHDHSIVLPGKLTPDSHDIHIHMYTGGRITPNFIGNYEHFDRGVNLKRLLEDYSAGKPEGVTIFKDRVVMVGGTYDRRDFYMTPVGRMSGMEIMANTTQNLISGNLITHASFWRAFVLEVILGALVALTFILTSRLRATVICFVTVVPAVATASILAFSTTYYCLNFVPTIAGVIAHGWVKKVEEDVKTVE